LTGGARSKSVTRRAIKLLRSGRATDCHQPRFPLFPPGFPRRGTHASLIFAQWGHRPGNLRAGPASHAIRGGVFAVIYWRRRERLDFIISKRLPDGAASAQIFYHHMMEQGKPVRCKISPDSRTAPAGARMKGLRGYHLFARGRGQQSCRLTSPGRFRSRRTHPCAAALFRRCRCYRKKLGAQKSILFSRGPVLTKTLQQVDLRGAQFLAADARPRCRRWNCWRCNWSMRFAPFLLNARLKSR